MSDQGATTEPQVEYRSSLAGPEVDAVHQLVRMATVHDGSQPLSDDARLCIRHGGHARARNVLLYTPNGDLAGYAYFDPATESFTTAEVVIHPDFRRRGYGRLLLKGLLARASGGRLQVWARGHHPAARHLAAQLGLEQDRALLLLRRSLAGAIPPTRLPAGVKIRTFRPGADERSVVRLNALAFHAHPTQGAWTLADLLQREHEPWFDKSGFFLAHLERQVIGIGWTKVDARAASAGRDTMGEIYVLAVHPAQAGRGIGRALLSAGLVHLRGQGLEHAMLYVDRSNRRATDLYQRLGFMPWGVDTTYRTPPRP